MQQNQGNFDAKNAIVIGKTGLGKSYFLNMLLKDQTPESGVFTVYNRLESGTHVCQMEKNRYVQYGPTQNEAIHLNLVDTPGLFDTKDNPNIQYHNQFEPQSIQHLRNIQNTVINQPFQNQFNRVILVLSSDQKFDVQHQGMIEICKIMIGQQLKVCVAITKCQNLYDRESEDQEIIGKLKHFANEWKKKLSQFGIEDVFFFSRYPINKYEGKPDEVSRFYYDQWRRLYDNLKKSIKSKINNWDTLKEDEKQKIGKYFNYRIGKTEEQKMAEFMTQQEKLQMQLKFQQEEQRRKELERELYYQQQLLEKERQTQDRIQKSREESDRALGEQLQKLTNQWEKKQNQMDKQMQKKLEEMQQSLLQNYQEKQDKLEKQLAESENKQRQLEAEVKKKRQQVTQSSGGGFCLSLDVTLNSIDNQMKYDQIFHNKVNLLGYNQSNVCLGLSHLSKTIECNFYRFTFQYEQQQQSFIELTGVHLIYCLNKKEFIRAEDVVLHDQLLYSCRSDQFQSVNIINIEQVKKLGYYCPLTSTGQVFANGILVSCYISPYEFPVTHGIAQILVTPLILYRQLTMKYQIENQQVVEKNQPEQYLAPFAKILSIIFRVNV